VHLNPKRPRGSHRVDTLCAPPNAFVTGAMQFAMMSTAESHGEFVADLEAETSGLRKAQMVGIAGLPTKRRWVLSRWQRNSGKASTLLSILAGSVSAVASWISGEEAAWSGEGAASGVSASVAPTALRLA
jgi:hypothetical protein